MWLIQLAVVILVCNICGRLAERLGQCKVIGEISGGILLGPIAFGVVSPSSYKEFFTQDAVATIGQLGEIGLAMLMFEIGLEISVPSRRAIIGPAAIAVAGMLLPFGGGVLIAWLSFDDLAPHQAFAPYVLFCGVALSVSAVPVMARIVGDLNLERHPGASAALMAAMFGDLLGWCMLSLIVGFSRADASWHLLGIDLALLCIYVALLATVSKLFLPRLLKRLFGQACSRDVITIIAVFVLASGWVTSKLGFHSAFGALLIGLLLREVQGIREQFQRSLSSFVHMILMPIFFAYAGLNMQFFDITAHGQLLWLIAFVSVGFAGKYLGVFAGSRLVGHSSDDAKVIATLMNARGLMELIFLSIGLQLGVLPPNVYSILVIFALFTTAVTAPLLRRRIRHAEVDVMG